MFGSGRGCARSGANSFFIIKQLCRTRLGLHSGSGRSLRRARSKRTCGTRAAGLRRREAAARGGSLPEPQIHDSKFSILNRAATRCPDGPILAARSARSRADGPARADLRDAKCGPLRGEAAALSVLMDQFLLQSKPAAERTGLRRQGAALRPGAAAGCRSLRDRFCQQAGLTMIELQAAPTAKEQNCGCRLPCDRIIPNLGAACGARQRR